jgi:hypothetical protein
MAVNGGPDAGPVMYVPRMDAFLNRWFNTYEEARESLESVGGTRVRPDEPPGESAWARPSTADRPRTMGVRPRTSGRCPRKLVRCTRTFVCCPGHSSVVHGRFVCRPGHSSVVHGQDPVCHGQMPDVHGPEPRVGGRKPVVLGPGRGAVLGDGSDALHQMVSVFTNFMESTAQRVKAPPATPARSSFPPHQIGAYVHYRIVSAYPAASNKCPCHGD